MLLFLVLAGNFTLFNFYVVTRSYSSHLFLCALGITLSGLAITHYVNNWDVPLLQKESKGDILLSLEYNSKQCVLDGMILKVTTLEKQDVWGLAGLKIHLKHRILSRSHLHLHFTL